MVDGDCWVAGRWIYMFCLEEGTFVPSHRRLRVLTDREASQREDQKEVKIEEEEEEAEARSKK